MTDHIDTLKDGGIKFVFRYYSYTTHIPEKRITLEEAQALSSAGIQIVMVYQDWGRGAEYFTSERGAADAHHALQYAEAMGQPHGSAIYFAVDDDLPSGVIQHQVFTYFDSVISVFSKAASPYKIGVYGSGLTCRLLKGHSTKVVFGWLAESTGWEESGSYTGWDVQQHISTGNLGDLARDEYERCDAKTDDFGGFSLGNTPLSDAVVAISRVIAQAREDIGVVEVPRGSNRGPRVNAMLAYTNTPPGNFWCAAAVAAWGIEGLAGNWPLPKSASCDDLLRFARRRQVLRTTPKEGDIFLVMRDDDDAFHTGIVTGIDDGFVKTIEGNTDPAGSSNGYTVAARNRSTHNLKFVRWVDLVVGGGGAPTWTLLIGKNRKQLACTLRNGMAFVPLREFLSQLFTKSEIDKFLKWTPDGIEWNNTAIPSDLNPYMSEGITWIGVRAAAVWMNLILSVDTAKTKITLQRP